MSDSSRGQSITHDHLLAVVHTELIRNAMFGRPRIRVLDAGCGSGKLMMTLSRGLEALHPGILFEVYGLEVVDFLGKRDQRKAEILKGIFEEDPTLDWNDRILMTSINGDWPFPDAFFDVVVSNQVLEHVEHPGQFFAQIERVLSPGGVSAHLFPLGHCLWEDHIKVPFAAWARNHDLLFSIVYGMNRIGFGRYRRARRKNPISLRAFAEREADYVANYTNYLDQDDFLRLGKKHHLRVGFRYTQGFYGAKLRKLFRIAPRRSYAPRRWGWIDALLVYGLRYVSSVTLFLEKKNTRGAAPAAPPSP